MESILIAGAATVLMVGVVLFGVTRVFRQRKYTMADLPELPPPSQDDNGPTRQA
jgi:hypothetical protein